MKEKQLILISVLIIILSAAACIPAVLPADGETYMTTSQWGEQIEMHGRGLYSRDSHSYAVQGIAQDWVTLIIGIPLLTAAIILTYRGNFRGRLLLTGVLGYFLYTYMSYSFLMTYNNLFLLYVALFSLSLFGFISSFAGLNLQEIGGRVKKRFPEKPAAVFFILVGLMLLFMWLGRIIPSIGTGEPPVGIDTYTTLVIQAMDLGIIVPISFIAAVGLLRKSAIGYALSTIIALKGITLFSAVSTMAVLMKLSGIAVSTAELIIFPAATLINFVLCFFIIRNVE